MFRKIVVALLLLALLVSVNISCMGKYANPSATLARTSGEVLIMKAGTENWIKAASGTNLEMGDCIKTRANSSAIITFFEGSVSDVSAETEICVEEMSVSGDTGSTTIKLHQEIGNTSSRVEKLVDPASRYEIETPDGIAAVRSSVMGVMVLKGLTIVDAIKGECWAIAQGKEVLVMQGTRSTMRKGQAPSPAVSPTAQAPSPPPISPTQALPSQDMDMLMSKRVSRLSPPTVETGDADTRRAGTALLDGELTSLGTAPVVQVSFEWGTTSGGPYPNETTPQMKNAIGSFEAVIGSLSNDTYFYRAKANGGVHGIGYGTERSFSLGQDAR